VASAEILSPLALNRALLARQQLLERSTTLGPLEAVEHLVGMQAQSPQAPYVGLWARLESFDPAQLGRLVEDRRAVRMSLMRTTLHLVSAADAYLLRPTLQPVLEAGFRTGSPFGRRLAGADVEAIVAAGRSMLEEEPLTVAQLGARLRERWPALDAEAMGYAVRYLVPVVQVPPRGVWRRSGLPRLRTAEAWLGRPVATDSTDGDLEALILRYLGAFGPASVMDAQAWSWLTRLRPAFERLRPNLRTWVDERGTELFDVPDAPRPPAGTPAPVRFLPEYDNLLVSHADRSRVTTKGYLERAFTRGSFLVDGFVRGAWRALRDARSRPTAIEIDPFEPLSSEGRREVEAEAERLAAFLADGPRRVDVRLVVASG
jgi:hypothetical protein